jgi:hypothetical protein
MASLTAFLAGVMALLIVAVVSGSLLWAAIAGIIVCILVGAILA